MNKTEVAREVRDELHTAEASLEAALTDAKRALARMVAARGELGLNGTMGLAAIAGARASVDALEQARAALIDAHQESYRILQATNIRGVASVPTFIEQDTADGEARVA